MNTCIRFAPKKLPTEIEHSYYGRISAVDENGLFCIDQHFTASAATSLLVAPQLDDLVCFVEAGQGYYIVQILQRSEKASRQIDINLDQPLAISAPEVSLLGWNRTQLCSADQVSISAQHTWLSAAGSLVQQAQQLIVQSEQLTQNTSGIARSSAQQHIMTASEDVVIDGKRINMG